MKGDRRHPTFGLEQGLHGNSFDAMAQLLGRSHRPGQRGPSGRRGRSIATALRCLHEPWADPIVFPRSVHDLQSRRRGMTGHSKVLRPENEVAVTSAFRRVVSLSPHLVRKSLVRGKLIPARHEAELCTSTEAVRSSLPWPQGPICRPVARHAVSRHWEIPPVEFDSMNGRSGGRWHERRQFARDQVWVPSGPLLARRIRVRFRPAKASLSMSPRRSMDRL
jgi:hypothetical protein